MYTPPGFKNELVIIVSDQNIIRVIDGITSNMYKNRTVDAPFSSLDANCNNDGSIGITGTPCKNIQTVLSALFKSMIAPEKLEVLQSLAKSAYFHNFFTVKTS